MLILDPVFAMDEFELLTKETHEKAKKLAKLPGVYLNKAHLEFRKKGANDINDPRCHSVESTIVIMNDNTLVTPCYHHEETRLPIDGKLWEILQSDQYKQLRDMQGRYDFCKGCHINCYMDPSYNYQWDSLFLKSILSKWKYSTTKYLAYGRRWPIFKSKALK